MITYWWVELTTRFLVDLMKNYNALLAFFSPFLFYNYFSYSVSLPPFPKNHPKQQNIVVRMTYFIHKFSMDEAC